MRKLYFRKHTDPKRGIKRISISNNTDDKECQTKVRKSFIYRVKKTKVAQPVNETPLIRIKKSLNTKKGIERFTFMVKGNFFMTHDNTLLEVKFQHCLNIYIVWKVKVFSSKNSKAMT